MHNCHSFGNRKHSQCTSEGACGDFVGETEENQCISLPQFQLYDDYGYDKK